MAGSLGRPRTEPDAAAKAQLAQLERVSVRVQDAVEDVNELRAEQRALMRELRERGIPSRLLTQATGMSAGNITRLMQKTES